MAASYSRDLPAVAILDTELEAHATALDAAARPGIVHGDFRLDNVLVDGDDRPRAVIDREMATVGDPVTDLALMLLYTRLARLIGPEIAPDAGDAPGFLGEPEIIARYAVRSGRDLGGLGFHLGLAAFKLASILEGIHYRHLGGQTVGLGFDRIGEAIHPLLDTGIAALKEH